jgi:phage-related protein
MSSARHFAGRRATPIMRRRDYTGVREIRVRESSGVFRCIYLATRPEGIYVLHCFQKKTQKTSQQDLDLAQRRFRSILRKS